MTHGETYTGRYTVYFAGALDKVKIGCSIRPADRILVVGEWVPFPTVLLATIPGGFSLEAALHRMFNEEWSHGEWFDASPRLLAFIDKVKSGQPIEIVDRELSADADRRRRAIAEKKRVARWRYRLPDRLRNGLDAVPKGAAIPDKLLSQIKRYVKRNPA